VQQKRFNRIQCRTSVFMALISMSESDWTYIHGHMQEHAYISNRNLYRKSAVDHIGVLENYDGM
jgi:hypothetical protein